MTKMDTAAIEAILARMAKRAGVPGAAIAIMSGDEVYVQGYGVRSLGDSATVTPETLFANASTTKAFTATGVALLVDDGKMGWDDPVRKHLPEFRLNDASADALVTISDLLCHRTGLPRHDYLWYHSAYGRQEVLRRIGSARLAAPLRTVYQYQNICYMAAGEAIRAASGAESFEAFLKERLLKPLQMNRTNFSTRDAEADNNHAEPHRRYGGNVYRIDWLNFDNCGPAGTMNSSAHEMALWLGFQLSQGIAADGVRLLSEANFKRIQMPHTIVPQDEDSRQYYPFIAQISYCLGWQLQNHRDGHAYWCHSGAIDGFRSHVAIMPEKKIGLSIFVNAGTPIVESFRNAIFDLLLGYGSRNIAEWDGMQKRLLRKQDSIPADQAKDYRKRRKEGMQCPLPLTAFVGEYEDPAYGVATVELCEQGGKALRLRWNRIDLPLKHLTFTQFITMGQEDTFGTIEASFIVKPTGEIASLSLFEGEFMRRSV